MKHTYLSKITKGICLLLTTILINSCAGNYDSDKEVIIASIAPIKYIIEAIVDDDFNVKVLVPEGASAETYEPTPKQYIELNESRAVMSVGLIDFEKSLLSKLEDTSRLTQLSAGVRLIAGECSHGHGDVEGSHGVDPHIWTSPVALQRMALNCYEAIAAIYPDSTRYQANYQALQQSLEELDNRVTGMVLASQIKSFIIYHPAYTYFARDYNIEQIAIENEGKEPSTRRIGEIIDRARNEEITQILYQNQFPSSVVDVIAKDANAEAVAINPLSEDIIAHIEEFTQIITGGE